MTQGPPRVRIRPPHPVPPVPNALREAVLTRYDPAEFPALWASIVSDDRPLAGVRVLNAFPLFHNTLTQFWALMAAGAQVTASAGGAVPADPQVVAALPDLGIPVVRPGTADDRFDVVLDCAGAHAHVPSTHGYVELTKSGERAYRDCPQPVFLVDAGAIKRIENSLGTGDGFMRGLAHFGHPDLAGRSLVIFGGGKVGSGVAYRATASGARVTIVDHDPTSAAANEHHVPLADANAVRAAIAGAWCVVSATGEPEALDPFADSLNACAALIANMGAEDEFGPRIPPERVLNNKAPLNFALPEPTRLRYIDPSLALAVAGAVELVQGRVHAGLSVPDQTVEQRVLAPVRRFGAIAGELAESGL